MNKSVIGIIPLYDKEKDSYWMLPDYLSGIIQAGGIPVILPLLDDAKDLKQILMSLDGVLFPGGQDVNPTIYHQTIKPYCGEIYTPRDIIEANVLNNVIENNIPALGICRGIQFMNAVLGGTLYQDLRLEHPSDTNHQMMPPYNRAVHKVKVYKDTPLHDLLLLDELEVNSYHHQAINHLSDKLQVMAESEDGLIEAVYMPNHKFLMAVQWHPEFSKDKIESKKIFKAFITAASEKYSLHSQ